jgi:hypothetical protein
MRLAGRVGGDLGRFVVVWARSVLPERRASMALLRTMLISQVMGVAIDALNPLAPCQTLMKASCSTSSARSRWLNIRNAIPSRCAQVAR